MLCMEDTAFARLTMHPKKNMIRCFQYINRKACVHVGAGPERNTLHAAWNDDDTIQRIVHELNFGRYAAGRNGLHTAQQDCPVGRGKEKIA